MTKLILPDGLTPDEIVALEATARAMTAYRSDHVANDLYELIVVSAAGMLKEAARFKATVVSAPRRKAGETASCEAPAGA